MNRRKGYWMGEHDDFDPPDDYDFSNFWEKYPFRAVRQSKLDRTCKNCQKHILVGEYYLSTAYPPNVDGLTGPHWKHSSECLTCAEYWGRIANDPDGDLNEYREALR